MSDNHETNLALLVLKTCEIDFVMIKKLYHSQITGNVIFS